MTMGNSNKLKQLAENYLLAGKGERSKMLSIYNEEDQRTIVIKAISVILQDYKEAKAAPTDE